MADPLEIAANQKQIAKGTEEDQIVNKALKKRRRRKPVKKAYDKLAMLVPSVAKVLQGSSYGAAAGGFTPSVRTDSSNGQSSAPVSSTEKTSGWPGIAKAAECGKKKKGKGYHDAMAVKSSKDRWPGLRKEALHPALMGAGIGAGIGGLGGAAYGALVPGVDDEGEQRSRLMQALKGGAIGAGLGGGIGGVSGAAVGAAGSDGDTATDYETEPIMRIDIEPDPNRSLPFADKPAPDFPSPEGPTDWDGVTPGMGEVGPDFPKASKDRWPGLQKQSFLGGALLGGGIGALSSPKGERWAGTGHGAGIGAATGFGLGTGAGVGGLAGKGIGGALGNPELGELLGLLGGAGAGGYGGYRVGDALSEEVAGDEGQPWDRPGSQPEDEEAMKEELEASEGQLPEEVTAQPA